MYVWGFLFSSITKILIFESSVLWLLDFLLISKIDFTSHIFVTLSLNDISLLHGINKILLE